MVVVGVEVEVEVVVVVGVGVRVEVVVVVGVEVDMNKDEARIENMNNFAKKAIRHGEVVIVPIDVLPTGIEQVYAGKEYIVGHSETGHHHVAVADSPNALTVFRPVGADDGTLFLRVTKASRVEHRKSFDQHETKTLFRGLYQITIKRNYDYFAKQLEQVRD